jgi:hypothetical protein
VNRLERADQWRRHDRAARASVVLAWLVVSSGCADITAERPRGDTATRAAAELPAVGDVVERHPPPRQARAEYPAVTRVGDLAVDGREASLTVEFDRPVNVMGVPRVPVTIDVPDAPPALAYAGGSGTPKLLFRAIAPVDVPAGAAAFPAGCGQVIVLPGSGAAAGDAQIQDRAGRGPPLVRGVHPDPAGPGADVLLDDPLALQLVPGGGRLVVLGAHYQRITTVTPEQIQAILTTEAATFPGLAREALAEAGYALPALVAQPGRAVDVWKVTYRSTIPCQHGRATTATGMVAIPVRTAAEPAAPVILERPLVSYQHGTLWRKYEAPSYALQGDGEFKSGAARPAGYDDLHYGDPREARLAVAQFGGQGYVVIAADYFGMGDSPEAEGYLVKTSHQQACVDMLAAARDLLVAEHVAEPTDLFLSGWSQGALVTLAFLEKLEQLGIPVRAASTASTPAHLIATTTSILLNPRDGRDPVDPARTGIWLNTIIAMAAFAFEHSYQEPGFAATVIRPEFLEAARRFATRDHVGFEFAREAAAADEAAEHESGSGESGGRESGRIEAGDILVTPAEGTPPLRLPADLRTLMHPEYFDPKAVTGSGPVYYPLSRFAAFFAAQNSYEWPFATPVQMNVGGRDEAFSRRTALLPLLYQQAVNPRANPAREVNPTGPTITANEVVGANHRGTFLVALNRQRFWFNRLLGRDAYNPAPSVIGAGGDPARPALVPDRLDPPLPGLPR